ncbi:hypothetical protein SteCoe_6618 [Stentor coeruleus]|uniref:ELMO domain-containing protein n=1 Tax=Stentor coeruleus TaxID=5963 RepID=A0A1R2CPQ3_9CILI|nr:hypothetical protein SteCoe_6618 [Stentor coeruleus]
MENSSNRKFSFDHNSEDKKSIKETPDNKSCNINTPKFSGLKGESSFNENISKNIQKKTDDDSLQPVEKEFSNSESSRIPNFEENGIDKMSEAWEYTYESANFDSDDPSYDTIDADTIKNEGKNDTTYEGIDIDSDIDKIENSFEKIRKKPLNDIEKKTVDLKNKKNKNKVPYIKIEGLDKKKELINEWKIVSVREIEAVNIEDTSVLDTTFYNRSISSDYIIQYIEKSSNEVFLPKSRFSFFKALFRCFRIKPESLSFLHKQKEKLLKFSHEAFNPIQVQHVSMAKKLYTLLKKSDSCPIFGDHWKNIGFQGKTPDADLRKSGIFGLLCLLYFVEKYPSHSFEIYKYSIDISNKFNFASTCIFFAESALIALEDNTLYKYMETAKKVYEVVLDYFCGMVIFWFRYYTKNNGNILEIMKSVDYAKTYAKKNVDEILRLTKYRFS